jgi:hypothetical protein
LLADVSSHVETIQDPAIRQRLTEVIGTCLSQAPPRPGAGPSRIP